MRGDFIIRRYLMSKSPFIVGLTGGIGSGKSLVAERFAALGVPVIDADQVSRDCVLPGMPALKSIIEHFGQSYLDEKGFLNRTKLKETIFADPDARKWLENLLHPLINQQLRVLAYQQKTPYVIVMIPLLLENYERNLGADRWIDRVLVVDAPEPLQIKRVEKRDNVSAPTIEAILQVQMSRQERLKLADDVINNDQDIKHLQQQVLNLHEVYQNESNN